MRADSGTDGRFSNSHVVTPYSASVRELGVENPLGDRGERRDRLRRERLSNRVGAACLDCVMGEVGQLLDLVGQRAGLVDRSFRGGGGPIVASGAPVRCCPPGHGADGPAGGQHDGAGRASMNPADPSR
jgi:hypothetical protein